ncbi:MAG TPA: cysteine desulfurase NifS [Myxococcota bacterium]|nr:cysteine desulfurase NifS [Myxococcota bacterium]
MSTPTVYLDNNATTPVAPEVVEAMLPFLRDQFFNPSSTYPEARGPRDAIERARESVARLVGAGAKSEILFTSGATEGNNAALWGALRANPDRRHVVTTQVEHPAVLEVARELERNGYRVTRLGVDRDGNLDKAALLHALDGDTAVVSIMHGNNETGVMFPIAELSRIVKAADPRIVFHTDATQTVGKVPINLARTLTNVDILTLSGHKLHAPKGVGAMFVRRGVRWRPWQIGGHQERGRRAGTENVAGIVGLGVACDLARTAYADEERLRQLQHWLESSILAQVPNVFVNGRNAERLPNTTSFAFEYVEGESILLALSDAGICASSGSACTSGSLDPSHVLKAMDIPFSAAHGSLRISTSRYTTGADIERVIDVLPGVIASLRRISPYWDQATNAPRADVDVFVQGKYR